MKLKDLPNVDLPREKLAKYGTGKLTDPELLAVLLGSGTAGLNVIDLSKQILKKFVGKKLVEARLEELEKMKGLGRTKSLQILASLELAKRLLKDKQSVLILSPQDVWRELKDIREHKKEHFVVFYLDTRNQEVKREVVSVGTLNANLVHPREVYEPAIKCSAAQIIVAHNHPSGNAEPSSEDIVVTKRLIEAGKILGIELLDHVVVAKDSHTSLKEKGMI
ncbi:MAG: DNA repair protein RadC [bacterium]